MAASARERADEQRVHAATAVTDEERAVHEHTALSHDEAARLHERLADVYDRDDE